MNDGLVLHHVRLAQVAQNWFVEHFTDFQYMVLQPRSSDLKQISYLWDEVKRSICTKDSATANIRVFSAATERTWLNITPEVFKSGHL